MDRPPHGSLAEPLCTTAAVALVAFDDEGVITAANAALARMLDTDAAAMLGQRLDAYLSPAGRVIFINHLLPLLRLSGRADELALQLRPAQGDDLFVMCSAVREAAPGGARNECAFMRMNERRRIEAELLRVKRMVEHVPGALFQLLRRHDGSLCLPDPSDTVRALFALLPQSGAGTQDDAPPLLLESILAEDLPLVREGLQASARDMAPWRAEFRVRSAEGPAWRAVEAQPRLAASPGEVLWHGYASDISGRKAVEAVRVERDVAQQASHAKSEFLARASHELRTPLNGILGFARLLGQDDTLQPDHRRQLGLIESCGHALLRLVEEMFDIAALDADRLSLQLQPVPLAPLLRRCVTPLQARAQARGLRLGVDGADAGLGVQADALRLQQVLRALLDNALKFNRPGGAVRVRAWREGTRVGIAVQDSGIGLAEAQLAQLFQPFNRLGAQRLGAEGVGLSLAVAKGLVERMNGRLEVRSRLGEGSEFTLWLDAAEVNGAAAAAAADAQGPPAPVLPPAPAPLPTAPLPPKPQAGTPAACPASPGERRLLYVEDNPLNVLLMQALLAQRPQWQLCVAGTVEAGLATALAFAPQLLLLDMHLPDGDGIELLQQLRAQPALREVPAIAVSADALVEDIRTATAAGFDAYWTKPLDMARVLQELDARLGHEAPQVLPSRA